jgi:hypothetical protein
MSTHAAERWRHKRTGEIWAVETMGRLILGVAGPLPPGTPATAMPDLVDYGWHDVIRWMEMHREDFDRDADDDVATSRS